MKKLLIAAVAIAGSFFVFGGTSAQAGHFHASSYGCAPVYGHSYGSSYGRSIYRSPHFHTQSRYYGGSHFGRWNNRGHHHHHHGHHGHGNFRGGRGFSIRF